MIEDLMRQTVNVEIKSFGKEITIPVRCLTATEAESLEAFAQELIPPMKLGEDGKPTDEFDRLNPGFQSRLRKHNRMIRSLGVFLGCQVIRDAYQSELDPMSPDGREKIHAWISARFTESALDTLWMVIRNDGASIEGIVNFSSPVASTQS